MLALIKIADAFKDQLLFQTRLISSTIRDLPPNPAPADLLAAIQTLQHLANATTLDPNALELLATEKAHFKLNATRNNRLAAKARIRRGQDADQLGRTAPASIQRHVTAGYDEFFQKSTAGAIPKTEISKPPFTGAAAAYNTTRLLSDEELAKHTNIELAEQKIEINKFHTDMNMPEPYPDVYDDSIPLSDDHKRHLGIPTPPSSSLF